MIVIRNLAFMYVLNSLILIIVKLGTWEAVLSGHHLSAHIQIGFISHYVEPSPVFRIHAVMLLPNVNEFCQQNYHHNKKVIGLISRPRTCFFLQCKKFAYRFRSGVVLLSGGRCVVESFTHARTLRTLTKEGAKISRNSRERHRDFII